MRILRFAKRAIKALCPYGIVRIIQGKRAKNKRKKVIQRDQFQDIGKYCAFKRIILDPENGNKYLSLVGKLIDTERKYGGYVANIKRNKVSPHDPRSEEQIRGWGMIGHGNQFSPDSRTGINLWQSSRQLNIIFDKGSFDLVFRLCVLTQFRAIFRTTFKTCWTVSS